MSPIARLAAAALLGLSVAACSIDAFTYTIDRYGTATVRQVHLGCRDTYEVFDRPARSSFLVVTNGFNEALAASCRTGSEALPRPERVRRVAAIFLDETTSRPDCRIVGQRDVSAYHTEFDYRCAPADTRPPPGSTKPARRG